MQKVLAQAQVLAEAILDSDEYIQMRIAEQAVTRDEESTRLIADFIEKRQRVENILAQNDLNHGVLAEASEAMDTAQKQMNAYPLIDGMQTARAAFTEMMNNVNKLIRFVVTGETEEPSNGCSGSCDGCSGCDQKN